MAGVKAVAVEVVLRAGAMAEIKEVAEAVAVAVAAIVVVAGAVIKAKQWQLQ